MAGRIRRPPISALWIRAQMALARDVTAELAKGAALVLTPHPDDETIACGLIMAHKVAKGIPVTVVLATDGRGGWYSDEPEPSPEDIGVLRHAEWHRGLDALGVGTNARQEFGLPDGGLEDHEAELTARIGRLLEEHRPAQVFVTSPDDLHADHRALGRATCQALVDAYGPASGGSQVAPALFAYRVYPAAGIWPDGHPGEARSVLTILQMVKSAPRMVADRAWEFRASDSGAAKREAIAVHASQKKLLDGELRYVWSADVELFRPLAPEEGRLGPRSN
jgi:LmbE family N-acetylglucosaminyl deacetylase